MAELTPKQGEILEYIVEEVREKGYPPTVREIGKAVNLKSSSTVYSHLMSLEKKGFIRRDPTKPRAIEILTAQHKEKTTRSSEKRIVDLPILGRVAAGSPILAVEDVEDFFPLPLDFVQEENCYILQIKGESMIEVGIMDGDYVIVRQQSVANNGEIIVALLDNEATVKTFYKEKDYIRLQPENSLLEPIIVQDVKILGKVIGLFRKMN